MANKEIPLSSKGINDYIKRIERIKKIYESKAFVEYIANMCYKTLTEITAANLRSEEEIDHVATYRHNHKMTVTNREIILWNNTVVMLDHLSQETQSRYGGIFQLAKAVEFGVGAVSNKVGSTYGWQYAMNPDRDYSKAWAYDIGDGVARWTRGYEGKQIFIKTKIAIELNIEKWIKDYIEMELKK